MCRGTSLDGVHATEEDVWLQPRAVARKFRVEPVLRRIASNSLRMCRCNGVKGRPDDLDRERHPLDRFVCVEVRSSCIADLSLHPATGGARRAGPMLKLGACNRMPKSCRSLR